MIAAAVLRLDVSLELPGGGVAARELIDRPQQPVTRSGQPEIATVSRGFK